MAARKRIDPIKLREKRAKIAAGVGGVLLLVVGAYEVPKILSQLNPKAPPAAKVSTGANPGPAGSTPLATVATSGLADTDVPPVAVASDGKLLSFGVFQTKNPFTPQVSATPTLPGAPAAPSTANRPGADVPGTPTPTTPTTPGTSTPTSTTPLTPPLATTPTTTTPTPAPTVAISVNGRVSRVLAEGTFPTGAPVFRLVSWQRGSAEIGIVGGSYATGGLTLTLQLGRPVTLKNTNDGKQYKLVLVSTP